MLKNGISNMRILDTARYFYIINTNNFFFIINVIWIPFKHQPYQISQLIAIIFNHIIYYFRKCSCFFKTSDETRMKSLSLVIINEWRWDGPLSWYIFSTMFFLSYHCLLYQFIALSYHNIYLIKNILFKNNCTSTDFYLVVYLLSYAFHLFCTFTNSYYYYYYYTQKSKSLNCS